MLFAEADLCKDESFIDLKLNVIGLQSKNLLDRPKDFMGPSPNMVSFEATPTCGTKRGAPRHQTGLLLVLQSLKLIRHRAVKQA